MRTLQPVHGMPLSRTRKHIRQTCGTMIRTEDIMDMFQKYAATSILEEKERYLSAAEYYLDEEIRRIDSEAVNSFAEIIWTLFQYQRKSSFLSTTEIEVLEIEINGLSFYTEDNFISIKNIKAEISKLRRKLNQKIMQEKDCKVQTKLMSTASEIIAQQVKKPYVQVSIDALVLMLAPISLRSEKYIKQEDNEALQAAVDDVLCHTEPAELESKQQDEEFRKKQEKILTVLREIREERHERLRLLETATHDESEKDPDEQQLPVNLQDTTSSCFVMPQRKFLRFVLRCCRYFRLDSCAASNSLPAVVEWLGKLHVRPFYDAEHNFPPQFFSGCLKYPGLKSVWDVADVQEKQRHPDLVVLKRSSVDPLAVLKWNARCLRKPGEFIYSIRRHDGSIAVIRNYTKTPDRQPQLQVLTDSKIKNEAKEDSEEDAEDSSKVKNKDWTQKRGFSAETAIFALTIGKFFFFSCPDCDQRIVSLWEDVVFHPPFCPSDRWDVPRSATIGGPVVEIRECRCSKDKKSMAVHLLGSVSKTARDFKSFLGLLIMQYPVHVQHDFESSDSEETKSQDLFIPESLPNKKLEKSKGQFSVDPSERSESEYSTSHSPDKLVLPKSLESLQFHLK
eukprot:GHVP01048497.1.p2 GENE.GHVP01048497.1~~GHVP01048497.1.p2  ORF type:complete len:620 (+),score=111.97 GHVP01048497.1:3522-5381(+)